MRMAHLILLSMFGFGVVVVGFCCCCLLLVMVGFWGWFFLGGGGGEVGRCLFLQKVVLLFVVLGVPFSNMSERLSVLHSESS